MPELAVHRDGFYITQQDGIPVAWCLYRRHAEGVIAHMKRCRKAEAAPGQKPTPLTIHSAYQLYLEREP